MTNFPIKVPGQAAMNTTAPAGGSELVTNTNPLPSKWDVQDLASGLNVWDMQGITQNSNAIFESVTGAAFTIPNGCTYFQAILSATAAAMDVTLPSLPLDTQEVGFGFTAAVTALTLTDPNGHIIDGAPTTAAANQSFKLIFSATNGTWYRMY